MHMIGHRITSKQGRRRKRNGHKDSRRAVRVSRRYHKMQSRFGSFWPLIMGTVFIVVIFVASIFVYMFLEGWTLWDSFYMVVITLSTVGYGEIHPLSTTGRIFTSALIFLGVGSFMFMAGSVAQLLVEGKLNEVLGRRRVQKAIDKLKNHFIVCGYGRIGSVVAQEIRDEGHPVVVIEFDPEVLAEVEDAEMLYLAGDATSEELLMRAGIDRARCVIAALSKEAANVYVVLTARQLNPSLYIVSRSESRNTISKLERAGADRVVLPHMIGGLRMAQSVLRPTVTSFVELAVRGNIELQMEELTVTENSEVVGKNLIESEIRPRFNTIIIGVKNSSGEMVFNPAPQYVIQDGDTLLCVGNLDNLEKMEEIL